MTRVWVTRNELVCHLLFSQCAQREFSSDFVSMIGSTLSKCIFDRFEHCWLPSDCAVRYCKLQHRWPIRYLNTVSIPVSVPTGSSTSTSMFSILTALPRHHAHMLIGLGQNYRYGNAIRDRINPKWSDVLEWNGEIKPYMKISWSIIPRDRKPDISYCELLARQCIASGDLISSSVHLV